MSKPHIQIDGLVREMTDEEYAELLESGWTLNGDPPQTQTVDEHE